MEIIKGSPDHAGAVADFWNAKGKIRFIINGRWTILRGPAAPAHPIRAALENPR
jgi:hypothetical protein